MSYTVSQAVAGRGTQFSFGPVVGTSSPAYVPVFEVESAPFNGPKWDTMDVTNLNSGGFQELVETIQKWPTISLTGNWVATDPGQLAVVAAQSAGGLYLCELQLPKSGTQTSTGNLIKFNALVLSYSLSDITPTSQIKLTIELQPSGAFTQTAGS